MLHLTYAPCNFPRVMETKKITGPAERTTIEAKQTTNPLKVRVSQQFLETSRVFHVLCSGLALDVFTQSYIITLMAMPSHRALVARRVWR